MEIKLAIFDMDGLIFDSERAFERELKEVMHSYGYKLTEDIYKSTIGLTGQKLKEKMLFNYGKDYPFEEISKKARQKVNYLSQEGKIDIKNGIPELLMYFNEKGIKCAVASSTKSQYVDLYLGSAGLRKYFNSITGGEETERSKPEPDIFLAACKKENAVPENTIVFEDSPNGVTAALRAKMNVVCIPDLVCPPDELIKNALFVAKDAFEAKEFIKNVLE